MRKNNEKTEKALQNDILSSIFCVAGEMNEDNGEDSYYYAVKDNRVIVSVFDGCGGIGARRYGNYSDKTGAFVASRAVCGGVKEWFLNANGDIRDYIKRALKVCTDYGDKAGRLMGSLGKSFPTTAAVIVVAMNGKDRLTASCYWAGDSRGYLLDFNGLHQLSTDDVDGEDAYSNLSDDGVLKNVISAGAAFEVNCKVIDITGPCVLFTATDGCFGYLNSPAVFEHMLLDTCIKADSIMSWKRDLDKNIQEFTGDDYTMSVAAFGFDDFCSMQKFFLDRCSFLKERYIDSELSEDEKWNSYKDSYYSY